jgi:hypothetical protein
LLKFRSTHSSTAPSPNATKELQILSHGVGYTAGTLSLEGYRGDAAEHFENSANFAATYEVGIFSWDYYYDAKSLRPRTGANYSWRNTSTFAGPVRNATHGDADGLAENAMRIVVEKCWRGASAVMQHGVTSAHTGELVLGCEPRVDFRIVGGRVLNLTFDNTSCLVTGLTCHISLPGYRGSGFAAYFTTGITKVTVSNPGAGYVCDWACFISLNSVGPGSQQACPLDDSTCSNPISASAQLIYSDSARVVSRYSFAHSCARDVRVAFALAGPHNMFYGDGLDLKKG